MEGGQSLEESHELSLHACDYGQWHDPLGCLSLPFFLFCPFVGEGGFFFCGRGKGGLCMPTQVPMRTHLPPDAIISEQAKTVPSLTITDLHILFVNTKCLENR